MHTSTDISTSVLFDQLPTHFVNCPNTVLAPASHMEMPQNLLAFETAGKAEAAATDQALFWHQPQFPAPHTGTSVNFVATTATANTLSLLLEGAQISLRGRTRSGSWIGVSEFPLTGKSGQLKGQIRGAVQQTAGTVSDVILSIGGLITHIVFDGATSQDFTEQLSVKMRDGTAVQTIALILLCERQPSAGECLLAVDSVDLTRAS